jgi:polar amino acid transport system substrate-binding protein
MVQQRNRVGPGGLALLVMVSLAVAIFVFWSGPRRATNQSTLARIRATGVVRIGYANEAPYGYIDSQSGRITGEAPEIAQVILRQIGADEIEPVVTEFGSLIPGLKAGRFDVIAAGMYITPERAREINFSNPTYGIGEALLVASGNPLGLHSFEDVAAHDRARIGVMGGSVEHGYAKRLGVPDDRIVVFPDYASAVEGLKTDRVDSIAATVLTINDLLRKADTDQIEKAEPFTDPVIDGETVKGYGAFGFRKDDTELRDEFNRHLASFIGSAEHLKLIQPFGFTEETLPGDVTTDEIARMPRSGN